MQFDVSTGAAASDSFPSAVFPRAVSRGAFCQALSGFPNDDHRGLSPEQLIAFLRLDSAIEREYAKPANGFVDYSVGTHTAMAIGQRQKYALGSALPLARSPHSPLLGPREIDCALLLHDLAKYVPGEPKNAHAEHERTLAFIKPYLPLLPVSDAQLPVILDLIDNDSLGEFYMRAFPKRPPKDEKLILQDEVRTNRFDSSRYHHIVDRWTVEAAASVIKGDQREALMARCADQFAARAGRLAMRPIELFDIQMAFFQADTSSYTLDAEAFGVKAPPAIDYIFARDRARFASPIFVSKADEGRLFFARVYEDIYQELRARVSAAS